MRPPPTPYLARDEQHVVGADRRRRGAARRGRRGRPRWRPRSGPSTSSAPASALAERHVAPAEVGRHRHEAVAPPDDADDRHADADQRLAGGSPRPQVVRQLGEVGGDRLDRGVAAGAVDADALEDLAAEPDDGRGERVDRDLEGEDDGAVRVEADDRRGPARDARRLGPLLGHEVGRRQLADEPADGAAGQARCARRARSARPGRRRGARGRSRSGWRGGRSRCAARPLPAASSPGLCSFLPNVVTHWSTTPVSVSSIRTERRMRPMSDSLRWGVLSTANIARKKVIPGLRKADALRGRGDRVARRGARRARVADELGIPTRPRLVRGAARRSRRRRRLHPAAEPPPCRVDDRRRPCRQARPVREAAGHDRGRRRADGRGLRGRRRPPDGGVHVSPPSVVGGRARGRGVRPDRAAARRPELVLVLQRRPGEHPEPARGRRRRAVRHRLLLRQPVADAVRRGAERRSRPRSPAIRRAASTS